MNWFLAALLSAALGTPEQRTELESLLNGQQTAQVAIWFQTHPDETLPFIDHYFEGGLKIIEEHGDPAAAKASFAMGLQFAEIADLALGEVILSEYGKAFANWDSAQQAQFRSGQHKFRAGREAQAAKDYPSALKLHTESLSLAAPLGDHWGKAMAYGGIGEAQLALGNYRESRQAFSESFWIYSRVSLRPNQIQSLFGMARANLALGAPRTALLSLEQAASLQHDKDDLEQKQTLAALKTEAFQMLEQRKARRPAEPVAPKTP